MFDLEQITLGELAKAALAIGAALGGFWAAIGASKSKKALQLMKEELQVSFPDRASVNAVGDDVRLLRREQVNTSEQLGEVRQTVNDMKGKVDALDRGQIWIGQEVKKLEKAINDKDKE
jgi:hypothetical protein